MTTTSKWLLIANGAKANIYSYTGRFKSLAALPDGELSHPHPPSRDLTSSDRGRVLNTARGERSALEPTTDPHDYEKHRFVKEIAEFLDKHREQFHDLVIAAAPDTLGDLRQTIDKQVAAKVSSEIDKDFTHVEQRELADKLRSEVYPG